MRDMRDPQELGRVLLNRDKRKKITAEADILDNGYRAILEGKKIPYIERYNALMRRNGDIA